MSGLDLLWLLLPVAALSGWWIGRSSQPQPIADQGPDALDSQYFQGINYLLNEQPDQAVDVFIELLEVGADTVETHLALGSLYRRRGEVDRAIRIHQNLVARPTVSAEQRSEAVLELAQDYHSAGLLDRAEDLFRELADTGVHQVQALRQLIDVYELERDWSKAIIAARELESATGNQLGNVIAHYHCELAGHHREQEQPQEALAEVARAITAHPGCVRASVLEGDIHAALGAHQQALAAYRRVELQDRTYLQEIVSRVNACYAAMDDPEAARIYLTDLVERDSLPSAMVALSKGEFGIGGAAEFMHAQLERNLSLAGLDRLLELELEGGDSSAAGIRNLTVFKALTERLIADTPAYKCQHCGFPARSLHWQCPSCKHWSTVRPEPGFEKK